MPIKKLALVITLVVAAALVTVACGEGVAQPDDIVDVDLASEDGVRTAQAVNGTPTTTRDICTKCGCTATFFNCSCPTRRRLQCVLDGGPKKVITSSSSMSFAR
ncbi:MAG: hypothetical protein KC503_37980 [Myxococcales bacterium]|nr:hypothetical protein [Myxococcales bacterium]